MIYVMEAEPIEYNGRESWLCLSLNLIDRQAKVRASPSREESRMMVAEAIADDPRSKGIPVVCCPSLAEFGEGNGWNSMAPPDEVLQLTAEALVGMENQATLGMLAFTPTADAWLRTSALFLSAEPWRLMSIKDPIVITFTPKDGGPQTTRIACVGGAGTMPPSLLLLPDEAAFSRLSKAPENQRITTTGLEHSLLAGFDSRASGVRNAVERAYGVPFHPILLNLRNGHATSISDRELLELAAALGAIASLTERPVGRAQIDQLEAIAVRLDPNATRH